MHNLRKKLFAPVGGRAPVRWGVDLRSGHFSVKMYVKMKELGPIGGACARHAPPRSANACSECAVSTDYNLTYYHNSLVIAW